ncbi:MAG: pyridoxamine 5'-phosphate oxidase family protein [Acidiferrobacterales bacterium]|nr:pyridoxamine 5'-phosphate oxidase family protein [Acidiferrobacterales bacterium]
MDEKLPAWRKELEQALALEADLNTATYLQLATFDTNLGAQVRTLVFRGFAPYKNEADEHCQVLLMATDKRSEKYQQLNGDRRVQSVWYFRDSRKQFRLSGQIRCLTETNENDLQGEINLRRYVWSTMSHKAKRAFYSNAMGELQADADEHAHSQSMPVNFVVLALHLTKVEVLDIAIEPHRRVLYSLCEEGWKGEKIAL